MEKSVKKSTGINDKLGVEIFEGDILKVLYGNSTSSFSEIELVVFENEKFSLLSRDGSSSLESPHYSYEVIGNIKDNPDLFDDRIRMSFWSD